ncbi:hypothetical protein [Paenibacillus albus]|uniref:Uncharacterized protein n=1 Tax=Paenibacillus albus TaxID=2495582 RepID=A0A3Q8X7Q3_9BACL|nr:hypothetical protein [Paenibacillus albus]AZN41528.1 hypothetical protein EJC50_18975 [Paenibacillus albus]
MNLYIMAAIACFILFVEGIPLIKKGSRRDSITFIVIFVIAASISSMQSLGLAVPNPSDWYRWAFSPLASLLKGVLY